MWVSPKAARRPELYQLLKELGAHIETGQSPSEKALILVAPLGMDVTTLAAVEQHDATRVIGIDMMLNEFDDERTLEEEEALEESEDHSKIIIIFTKNSSISNNIPIFR